MIAKTDSRILKDVLDELKWDARVGEAEVGVEVDRGVVTLTGTVANWAMKSAAQEAAFRVAGVRDVANDIKTHTPGLDKRTDTEIAQAVRRALEWDVFVPDREIRSMVTDGGVTLTGDVLTLVQKDEAERAIRNLAGVRWVINRIEVRAPKIVPTDVRKAIEDALERHAERAAERIAIEIHDGTVTLHGRARSWAERSAIVGAATGTPGVVRVDDQITIQP